MPGEYRNIYQTARKAAGLTQEAAAEQLAVSVESLRAYENGYRVPPNDVVARMVICYDKQYLAIQHLLGTNPLAAQVIPEIKQKSLETIALQFYLRMKRFEERHGVNRIMEICEDGMISPDERPDLDDVLGELKEIAQIWLELDVFYSGEVRE